MKGMMRTWMEKTYRTYSVQEEKAKERIMENGEDP
jgi:hypothetical protein